MKVYELPIIQDKSPHRHFNKQSWKSTMKEKWYNKKISPKYCLIFIIILFIGTLLLPLQDIECSKIDNTCSIYSRSVILRRPKLVSQFNISDIIHYKIKDYYHGGRGHHYTSYGINIYLNSGEIIHIENETRSYERAQEIYNNMINSNNFILKGNYWHSLLNNY